MGNIEAFSDLISQLRSADTTTRATIIEQIGDTVYYQDMSYELALVAVPAFIALLNEIDDDENQILSILSLFIRDSKEEMDSSGQRNLHNSASETYALLCEGTPVYIEQLNGNNLDTRLLSSYILGLCSSSTIDIVSCLKMHFLNEINNNVRFVIIRSITFLNGYVYSELESMFIATNNILIKYAISLAMLEISHDFLLPDIEHIVTESLLHSNIFEEPYLLVPYRNSVFTDTCVAVNFVRIDKAVLFFRNIISRWDNNKDHITLIDLIEHLLDISGFRKRGRREWTKPLKNGGYSVQYLINKLDNDVQYMRFIYSNIHIQVILCIVECEAFWEISTNLLEAYYLSSSKADLLEIIKNYHNNQIRGKNLLLSNFKE